MRTSSRTILLAAFLLAAVSCSKPTDGFGFVTTREAQEEGGIFRFKARMDDSALTWSTSVAIRYNPYILKDRTIDLDIHVTSPAGEHNIERVTFPLYEIPDLVEAKGSTPTARDIEWPYRGNINIGGDETGIWKIDIQPVSDSVLNALYGLGFSYKGE